MNSNIFDRLSFLSIFLVIVLLPFFFLPFTNIPVEISKGVLLVIGLALSIIFWGLARFFDGKISFPRSATLLAGGGIVVAFFLSAFFLKAGQVSFFGTMFDIGTCWFMVAGFLLMLMCSIVLGEPKKAKIILFGAILSSAIVLIFQAVHLCLPAISSLGVLVSKTDNIVGSWNAFGIFAGFSGLMSLLVVEFFSTTRIEKFILQVFTIFSMVMVAAVNFPFVWELLGVFALVIFVYKVSISSKEKNVGEADTFSVKNHFPAFSFAIIMIALLFFISGSFIGQILPNRLGVQNDEINPSFAATMGVTKAVLIKSPFFGVGPNRFASGWAMYKPAAVNTSPFWDISFNFGSGLLPTFAITTGGLGILAFLIFFLLLITSGLKSIFSSVKNGAHWETMAFFVLSFYLFISCFFYIGGAVLFLLALAFAGIFIGLSASLHGKGAISVSYLNDHRKSFFAILFIIFILIITAALSFKYIERVVSVSYFRKVITASDITVAENSLNKALSLYSNDIYLRTYTQLYLMKLNALATKDASTLSDADKADLKTDLDQAVNAAQLATEYDPTNYLNFQALGAVYQNLAAFGVKDAYDKAIESYTKASTLNPNNPGIKLDMANTAFIGQKNQEAKDYANAALTLKPDYIDAYIFLSQLAKSEGDNASALSYGEMALSLSPTDTSLIQYVDSLKNPSALPTPTPAPKKTKLK